MSPEAGGTTVLLVGVLMIRLALTDAYLRYVQPAMGPWLVVAGAALVVLGGTAVVRASRAPASVAVHDEHAHGHSDRVGWLLVVPVLAVLLAPPPALGSYGVSRGVTVAAGGRTFATLATDSVPRAMTLVEFGERAADAAGASFAAQPVELTGFVSGTDDGAYRLARYQISCCAADAVAAVVRVHDASGIPHDRDTWVTVVGTFRDVAPDGTPEIDAVAALQVAPPVDPYE